nr:hypothetical protein Iba_chr07aCG9970 [Ipomoea batatas]
MLQSSFTAAPLLHSTTTSSKASSKPHQISINTKAPAPPTPKLHQHQSSSSSSTNTKAPSSNRRSKKYKNIFRLWERKPTAGNLSISDSSSETKGEASGFRSSNWFPHRRLARAEAEVDSGGDAVGGGGLAAAQHRGGLASGEAVGLSTVRAGPEVVAASASSQGRRWQRNVDGGVGGEGGADLKSGGR